MSRSATLLLLVASCAASAAELRKDADRDNPQARASALARFTRAHDLTAIEPPVVASDEPIGEGVVTLPDGQGVGFVESACAAGDSCGCDVGAEYHYWREGSQIVIARMVPDVEVHRVVRAGTCGEGCGVEAAPPMMTTRALGPIAPADVKVVDLHYHYDQVVETCDHPMPLP